MLCAALAFGCSDAATSTGATAASADAGATAAAADQRRARPLPAYEGVDLSGTRWSTSDLVGRRTLLFGFDPKADDAPLVADAVAAIADQQEAHNFRIVGVARTDAAQARAFLDGKGLRVRSFLDPAGTLGQRIGVRQPVWLILTDAQGNLQFGTEYFPSEGADPASAIATTLRDELRLPGAAVAAAGRPLAPDFSGERLEGGPPLTLSNLRGQPTVLIFFLHTCPHCHEALAFLKDALAALPEASRPKLLGVSVANRTWSVQEALRERDLDFFPVVLDPDASIRSAYSALQGVPVVFLIDAEGRLVSRTDGWEAEREPALLRMRLARLAGQPVPMLLHKTGYSGNDVCGICHEDALATWELTNHASAYDTLVRHGADHDAECVRCHVVGYGESGGFSLAAPNANLEDVGCESCHGRGGPHLSPEHAKRQDYEALCRDCHNPEHSLGFEYTSFLPRVSHAANRAYLELEGEARERFLAERRAPRENLLPTAAAYVGSEACASCHPDETAKWADHPHAHALESLAKDDKAGDADCLRCHTTGFGRPGGYALDGGDQPALAAVGCEACHGPGGDHVGEGARRQGTIVKLSDKCGSCVILQVCGTCHDDANDPGFEFEVKDKILHQRHSTEPLDFEKQAARPRSTGTTVGLLEQAFRTGSPG
jgi:peroxiredoxin